MSAIASVSESTATFSLSPAAETFMRRMVRLSGLGPTAGFRLVVSPGGCSGLKSEFSIESQPAAGDRTLLTDGLKLFVPPASAKLLEGVTIDFADTSVATGLQFLDPKAPECGCKSTGGAPIQLTTFGS